MRSLTFGGQVRFSQPLNIEQGSIEESQTPPVKLEAWKNPLIGVLIAGHKLSRLLQAFGDAEFWPH